ncbi:MAG TPA: hypothetical protein VGR06_39300 [Actinophytocola sp.]|jgi:tetratricopeptide (TPR) repeat protein|uniref:hypothetical protein n=1 Tax=Actinophytocola sp. TaxID=1872138 RepID=UPI002E06AFB5|nr:hypothetical protein [Actinophytocola sp.]
MASGRQKPNDHLRALLGRTRWSHEGLARAVNNVGAEVGLVLSYDRTAVAHWLSGTCPRGETPGLIAEALSRRLGRALTVADIGLAPSPDPATVPEPRQPGDPVAALLGLTHADADPTGHARLRQTLYQLHALAVPGWPQAASQAWVEPGPQGGRGRIAAPHVDAAHRMAGILAMADRGFGGGHARTALTAYLAHDITTWLRARASETTHHEMLGAATDLVLLAGFKSFDCEEHGLAQRYYLTALALAARGADPIRYAIVLRAMSQQAHQLGHHEPGLELAGTALATTSGRAQPCTEASLHAQAAVCHAALGQLQTALLHRDAAHRQLERATGPLPVFGCYHAGELAYQTACIRTFAGDTRAAIAALHIALRHYPASERRSRVLTLAALAQRQLDTGLLSVACATTQRLVDDYPYLQSARATTALTTLLQRLDSVRHLPAVQRLLHRTASLQVHRPGEAP